MKTINLRGEAQTRNVWLDIGSKFPDVRIAFTHTPMTGVTVIPKEPIVDMLKASDDEYKEWYVNGLEDGSMVAIVENQFADKYYAPGELFFNS